VGSGLKNDSGITVQPRVKNQVVVTRTTCWTVVVLVALGAPSGLQAKEPTPPLVTGVAAVEMTVGDLDRSMAFYATVLSFTKVSEGDQSSAGYQELIDVPGAKARTVQMRLGREVVALTQFSSPSGRPVPPDSTSNDLWFQHVAIVVGDMQKAYARLQQHGVQGISDGPQRLPAWNKDAADIEAYYFRDPDGHPLELIHFPKEKGDPRWQRPSDALFLGIDHTAIAISETSVSLKFYRLLGFQVRGHSLNYGFEQEHLSGIAGARVRITSLRASSGPGIELLEYQRPRTGRRMPTDERAPDLIHHQTTLTASQLPRALEVLCHAHVALVSMGARCDQPSTWESRHLMLFRDPDGHVMELAEP
jgi:catechol 2,3-dioxygenase-like lactoylglutathione lyase family enzyme